MSEPLFLDRTVEEVLLEERPERPSRTWALHELLALDRFILLGDPGMGKSRALDWLANQAHSHPPIHARNLSSERVVDLRRDGWLFVDALDEAQAASDQRSALQGALTLVDQPEQRWGISCRLADISGNDLQAFERRAEDGQSIRPIPVRLLPLRQDQVERFVRQQGVRNPEEWLAHVASLGWHDIASNPQSLLFLLKATEDGHWPETRSQVFEMACAKLVKEHNDVHRSRAKFDAKSLLHAAGWICALLLLCGKQRVADASEDPEDCPDALAIQDVEPWLPDSIQFAHVHQVLRTRLFHARAPVHRTVAEYLAAQSIASLVTDAGSGSLLARRLESLFLAGRTHLRTDLRGLAGWLGSLHRDFQPLIQRDPEALLFYGDLARLCDWDKQFLIASLAHTQTDIPPWEAAQQNRMALVPLVTESMQHYVQNGFERFAKKPAGEVNAAEVRAALVLLQGLQAISPDPRWQACLLMLVRELDWNSALREMALEALQRHSSDWQSALLTLWSDLNRHHLKDSDHRLFPALVQALYPASISLGDVLRHSSRWRARKDTERQSYSHWSMFWEHDFPGLVEQAGQLSMAAQLILSSPSSLEDDATDQFEDLFKPALPRLLARFVLIHGEAVSPDLLAQCWQRLMPYGSLERDEIPGDLALMDALTAWQTAHRPLMQAAMLERLILNEEHPHLANCFLRHEDRPNGRQYLQWTETMMLRGHVSLAQYCLREAYALAQWAAPVDRTLMEDAFALSTEHSCLQSALDMMTVQTLDPKDPTVRHQDYLRRNAEESRKRRKQEAAFLQTRLDDLSRVASGHADHLHFLELFAWTQLGGSYLHNHEHKLVLSWIGTHPELGAAADQGTRALLQRLEPNTWQTLLQKRAEGMRLRMELPVMFAAQRLHQMDASALAKLAEHQVLALWMCQILGLSHPDDWFRDLVSHHIYIIAPHWRQLLTHPPKGCVEQVRNSLDLLSKLDPPSLRGEILDPLLEHLYARLPATKIDAWLKFIRAALPVCNHGRLTLHLERLLERHATDPSVHSMVLVAALAHDPTHFAPHLQSLARTTASSKALMKAWHRLSDLLPLDQLSQVSLMHLFDMAVRIARPDIETGFRTNRPEYTAESVSRGILNLWSQDPSEAATGCLSQLAKVHESGHWSAVIRRYLVVQLRIQGERSVRMPKPESAARLLSNQGPLNAFDLSTIALEALAKLQKDIRAHPFNLRSQFWHGQTPKLENECRNVIGPWLKALLPPHIECVPEAQHSDQNRCDLQLSSYVDGQPLMLPIEIKMDWHRHLWTAPHEQLRDRYMGDRRCHHMGQPQGIFLVFWVGAVRGGQASPLKKHPNLPKPTTPTELQRQLESEIRQQENTEGIKVFVLDISASR